MKIKTSIILFLICIGVFIPIVLAEDLHPVSITEGGTQFVSIPANKNVIYTYSTDVPQNGILILSFPDNDTYLVDSENSIEMITVGKKSSGNIIDLIFGWL